jgi:hypothetical protein
MSFSVTVLRSVALASSLTLLVGYVVYSHQKPKPPSETPEIPIIGTKSMNQPIFSVRKQPVKIPYKPTDSPFGRDPFQPTDAVKTTAKSIEPPIMFDSSKSGRVHLPAWSIDFEEFIPPFDLFHSEATAKPEP